MDQQTTAIDRVNFLTQSPVRVRILRRLDDEGPLAKRALAADLEGCRTTVQRNLDALAERGWIENVYPEYAITSTGRLVREYADEMLEGMDLVAKLEPLLEKVPAGELGFDVHELADATVIRANETNPYAPVNRHVAAMQDAEEFRCLLPAVALQPMTVAHDAVERGQHQEVIVDERVANTLRTDPTYHSLLTELLAAHNCDLLVAADDLPYYLGICADCVQIGIEDDDGTPVALIESDAPAVRAWADQRYEIVRHQATPFSDQAAETVPMD